MAKGYEDLHQELTLAELQASLGKGLERHAGGKTFRNQPIMVTTRTVGLGFPLGQAMKKIEESLRLSHEQATAELHGAIIYLAAACLYHREEMCKTLVDVETPNQPDSSGVDSV